MVRMRLEDFQKLYRTMLYHYAGNVDILAEYIGVTPKVLKERANLFTSFDREANNTLDVTQKKEKAYKRFCLYFYLGGYSSLDLMNRALNASAIFEQAEEYAIKYGTKEEKAAFAIQKNKLGNMKDREEKIIEERIVDLTEILKNKDQKECIINLASFYRMRPSVFLDELKKADSKELPKHLEMSGAMKIPLPVSKRELFYHTMLSHSIIATANQYGINYNTLWKALRDYYREASPLERKLYCFSFKRKQKLEKIHVKKRSMALGSILYENIDLNKTDPDYFEEMISRFGLEKALAHSAFFCYCKAHDIVIPRRTRTSILDHANDAIEQLDYYEKEKIKMSDGGVRPYDFVDFYLQFYPFAGNSYAPVSKVISKNEKYSHWRAIAYSILQDSYCCTFADVLLDPKRFSIQQQITYPSGEVATMSLFCNLELRKQCVEFMQENHLITSEFIMKTLLERSRYGTHVYEVPSDMKFLIPKQKEKVKVK